MCAAMLDSDRIFSTIGRTLIGAVAGHESYDLYRICFGEIIDWFNILENRKKLRVGNTTVEVELFLGGDMSFLLTVLGMNAAMATFACMYCFVDKVLISNFWIFLVSFLSHLSFSHFSSSFILCQN